SAECHSSADPRLFPAFPTRRSSDLELAVVGRLLDLQVVVQADRGEAVLEILPVRVVVDVRTPGADGGEELFEVLDQVRLRLADQDRKSTRLNSSHVSISYAVFCLKK